MRLVPLLVALLGVGACNNSCQAICARMARVAEDCGISVPDAQLKECIEAQAGSNLAEGDRQACRESGSVADIERQWSCDDLEAYWAPAEDAE